jgi:hypothetical protein
MKTNSLTSNISRFSRRLTDYRALTLFAFVLAATIGSTRAVPITLNLDNPNQSVGVPSNGSTTVFITGTIAIDPSYHIIGVALDSPTNAQGISLTIATSLAFNMFQFNQGTGTFSGVILEITVPAGTPLGLYNLATDLVDPATFGIGVQSVTGGASSSASQTYSVLVTNGTSVPDGGSSFLLLSLSVVGLCFSRRAFISSGNRAA